MKVREHHVVHPLLCWLPDACVVGCLPYTQLELAWTTLPPMRTFARPLVAWSPQRAFGPGGKHPMARNRPACCTTVRPSPTSPEVFRHGGLSRRPRLPASSGGKARPSAAGAGRARSGPMSVGPGARRGLEEWVAEQGAGVWMGETQVMLARGEDGWLPGGWAGGRGKRAVRACAGRDAARARGDGREGEAEADQTRIQIQSSVLHTINT